MSSSSPRPFYSTSLPKSVSCPEATIQSIPRSSSAKTQCLCSTHLWFRLFRCACLLLLLNLFMWSVFASFVLLATFGKMIAGRWRLWAISRQVGHWFEKFAWLSNCLIAFRDRSRWVGLSAVLCFRHFPPYMWSRLPALLGCLRCSDFSIWGSGELDELFLWMAL